MSIKNNDKNLILSMFEPIKQSPTDKIVMYERYGSIVIYMKSVRKKRKK